MEEFQVGYFRPYLMGLSVAVGILFVIALGNITSFLAPPRPVDWEFPMTGRASDSETWRTSPECASTWSTVTYVGSED